MLLRATVLIAGLAFAAAGGAAGASPAPIEGGGFAPRFSRIFVVVIENQSFDDIFEKNPAAHYILDEMTPAAAIATRFYAPKRNSPTAYFAMSSGHTYTEGDGGHWAGKCDPSPKCSTADETVFEQLVASGRTWRIYSEDQEQPCQIEYGKKYWLGHNPALFYTRLGPNGYAKTGDGSCLKNDLPLDAIKTDFANGTIPDYALIIPNNCHNMHDACPPLRDRVLQGNAWLQDVMKGDELVAGGLIAWAQANDTLLVITYDEARLETDREGCCPYVPTGGGGHIPTWVIGPAGKVEPGARSDVQLSNFSILRTVEENWDLELLGRAGDDSVKGLDSLLVPAATRQDVVAPGGVPPVSPPEPAASSGAVSGPVVTAAPQPAATPVQAPATVPASRVIGDLVTAIGGLGLTLAVIVVPIGTLLLVLRRRSSDEESEGTGPAEGS